MPVKPIVLVPGSFDCLHSGHIELLKEAATHGDVYILLKGDNRLMAKKGKILMLAKDRKIILEAIKYVSDVIIYDSYLADSDDFSEMLRAIHPQYWAVGETKKQCTEPDYLIRLAEELGIKIIYGVGGDIIHSSSEILKSYGSV